MTTIIVENDLNAILLVESRSFKGNGTPGLIFPGETTTIHFSAAKGEALSIATMYGWSNDLFFAPENPGISVYNSLGDPVQGDVSSMTKLWDNGTKISQKTRFKCNTLRNCGSLKYNGSI